MTNQPNNQGGEAIRRYREAMGWTQAELAARWGKTQKTISLWESGTAAAPAMAVRLAEAELRLMESDTPQ